MPAKKKPTTIVAYKGFDRDLKCRDFQYEIGKTYEHDGKVDICNSGFHACEMPLDVFTYYSPATSRYCEVRVEGETKRKTDEDTKIASAKITIKAEISIGDLTRRAVAWVAEMAKTQGSGQYAAGICGHAFAAGDYGHASTAGICGHAFAAGDYGHTSAASTGSHAFAAGDYGHASAAGDHGHASAAGDRGHAFAAGDYSHAFAAGTGSHASAAGDRGHASVKGNNSIAHAAGTGGTATAHEGGAISLAAYDDDYNLVAVRSSLVGQNGIEAGKTYRLTIKGEFEEVKHEHNI